MKAVLVLMFAMLSAPVMAETNSGSGPYGKGFAERMKAKEAQTSQARIDIIQQGSSCFQAATTKEAARACKEQEREALRKLAESRRAEHEAMRSQVQADRESRQAERENYRGQMDAYKMKREELRGQRPTPPNRKQP